MRFLCLLLWRLMCWLEREPPTVRGGLDVKLELTPMSDEARSRLRKEFYELRIRVGKLERFIMSEDYDTLPRADKTDLREQLGHMRSYLSVLSRRVSRHGIQENAPVN